MQNFQKVAGSLFFTLIVTILLTGCGSSGADNQESNDDTDNPTGTPTENNTDADNPTISTTETKRIITGKIIDGEISGATIFLDLNRNGILDSDEPRAESLSDGSYTLEITPIQKEHKNYKNAKAPLIVYGGIDIRTGEEFTDYLSSMLDGNGTMNVTPLTTLIAQSMEEELSNDSNLSLTQMQTKMDEIKSNLAELLDIKKELLTKDPIALAKDGNNTLLNTSLQLHKVAKVMKKAMRREVRDLRKSILSTYRSLAKEFKKLRKSAIKSGDTALIEALDTALEEGDIFDKDLIVTVKEESKSLSRDINRFWQQRRRTFTDETLTLAIKDVEVTIVLVDRNTTTSTGDNGSTSTESNTSTDANKSISRAKAIKLLRQASFISNEGNISYIMENGSEAWIDKQLNTIGDLDNPNDNKYGYLESITRFLHKHEPAKYPASLFSDPFSAYPEHGDAFSFKIFTHSVWWQKSLHNEDQLRQRVAYALSQLLVTAKAGGPYGSRGESAAHYYDILVKHSFGNYRDLLKEVTMSAPMAYYLTYLASSKENNVTGTAPDENYARELMQLFTVGLYELNNDGTKQFNARGFPTPIYTQDDVSEMARVFTGWSLSSNFYEASIRNRKYDHILTGNHSFILPIRSFENGLYHDFGEKVILGSTIAAGLTPEQDIDRALDILMLNPNIGPHVCRELINRLVTSNPTSGYMSRVVAKFNDNGRGVKGDLKATVRAILTDVEARETATSNTYGKVDEYVLLLSHYLSSLDVKPYPILTYNGTEMEDTYWMRETPVLQADSVFNFYSPEYVPNDSGFSNTGLVAPEFEQRTDNKLMDFANYIDFIFKRTGSDKKTYQSDFHGVVINVGSYFEKLSMLVDGNNSRVFANLNDKNSANSNQISAKGKIAIGEFIDYVSNRLTGKLLPDDYKAELTKQLMTSNYRKAYISSQAQNIIRGTIRAIIMSPAYMVIK